MIFNLWAAALGPCGNQARGWCSKRIRYIFPIGLTVACEMGPLHDDWQILFLWIWSNGLITIGSLLFVTVKLLVFVVASKTFTFKWKKKRGSFKLLVKISCCNGWYFCNLDNCNVICRNSLGLLESHYSEEPNTFWALCEFNLSLFETCFSSIINDFNYFK